MPVEGPQVLSSNAVAVVSVVVATAVTALSYRFRGSLTRSEYRVAAAGGLYALGSVATWATVRTLVDAFHRGPIGGPLDAAGVVAFYGVLTLVLSTQLSIPLWLLGRRYVLGPVVGLFLGTALLLSFVLSVSYESGNLVLYVLVVWPLVVAGTGLLTGVESIARRRLSSSD